MPRVIAALLRHGDYQQLPGTPSAYQPFPLTDKGFRQATQATWLLRDFCRQFDCQFVPHIASSSLLRAWQTATQIAEELIEISSVVEEFDQLNERCVGSVANLSEQQIADIVQLDPRYSDLSPDWKSNSQFRLPFPGAESLLDAGARVADILSGEIQDLRQKSQHNQLKLFVGHGAAFRHAAYHLGILSFEQLEQLSMHHCRPILIELRDDNRWYHIAGTWKHRTLSKQNPD